MKNQILLLIKTPPPVTGATLMNKRVNDSELLRSHFDIRSICISYATGVSDLGKLSFRKIKRIVAVFFSLFREMIFHKPKVVYFQISPLNQGFYRDLIFVFLIKLFKIKILFHLHGKGIKNAARKRWKRRLYEYVFSGEDVICLSHLLTYDVEDVFWGKIHIVNNGIPDVEKKLRERKFDNSNDKVKLLFLSNLIKSKGILDFLETLSILKAQNVPFQGIIIGAEGDLTEQELMREIESKGLCDIVSYIGKKYGDEKFEVLKQTDIIVFPTKNDAFPAIPLEAMQFRIPVIATYEGAIPDIIKNDRNGFLVEKNNPEQIVQKLKILINDPALRKKMGKDGRKKYEEKYTLQHFENRMKKVFEEVLNDVNKKH